MFNQKSIIQNFVLAFLCLIMTLMLFAEEMPIPANLQAAMFQKILAFDKTLAETEELTILMVYSEKAPKVMEELKSEFEKMKINVATVELEKLSTKIEGVSALYVLPNVKTDAIKKLCIEKSILSISGVPELAEEGEVSVALGIENDKPKIIVNLEQVKAEGHQLSADLLKLAKIIK